MYQLEDEMTEVLARAGEARSRARDLAAEARAVQTQARQAQHTAATRTAAARRLDPSSAADLGPFVSSRPALEAGERIARRPADPYEIAAVVPAEPTEPFVA
jgi:hypothetical protein